MFLKSLEIFGFKSFPDRVHVEFADGITALLGPNGCGKSNVIDAIKWTLGEASSKALRADKMEDVIFNGSENRRQMNMAEVCLTIDNSSNLLNFEACEIAIKRRLYRSGESEYFINGQPARLKDIKEMFWDTGVGKVAYSVMEQGKIDQILSSKPEERKYLFEEAAGITKFKVKRIEAERRLEKTEENMKILYASLAEVKKRHDILKVQADKTIKYKQLKEEVLQCEIDIQLLKLKRCVDGLAIKKNEENELKGKLAELQKEIEDIDSFLTESMDSVNAMQEDFSKQQREVLQLDIERREKEKQVQVYAKMENELTEKMNILVARIEASRQRITRVNEEVDEKRGEVIQVKKKYTIIEENIQTFEENINLSQDKSNCNIKLVQEKNLQIKEEDKKIDALSKDLKGITEDIVTSLDEKLKEIGVSATERQKEGEELLYSIDKLTTICTSRMELIKDFFRVLDVNENARSLDEMLEKITTTFQEITDLSKQIREKFNTYKSHSALFIDEFLSPEGIITKKRRIDDEIFSLKEKIEQLKKDIENIEEENVNLHSKTEEYKKTLEALRIEKEKRKVEMQGIERECSLLEKQVLNEKEHLVEAEAEQSSYDEKIKDKIEEREQLEGEINLIQHKGEKLAERLDNLQKEIKEKNASFLGNKKKLEEYNNKRLELLSKLEKLQMDGVAFETEIKSIKENFKETHSRQIMEFDERMFTIDTNQTELREKSDKIKKEISSMGSVNFMAVEEFKEVKDRYEFLNTQVLDMEKAKKDLQRITEEIRAESTQLFVNTYQKIKKNFHNMFRRLFGGGRAEVKLLDPNNVLDSGIEIFAQPPGKKLENIGLLSGGEKSMTAVSLLFATYMVKPSPFCLLDEIDAALDEQNVIRFVTTLKEFANVSQYIIITHNKKTVVGANAMLGVTMEESGVSKMIAIKLDDNFKNIRNEEQIVKDEMQEEDVEIEEVFIPSRPAKRV